VEAVLRRRLAKDPALRLSNWEAAPLSAAQRAYAAADAFASLRLLQARAPRAALQRSLLRHPGCLSTPGAELCSAWIISPCCLRMRVCAEVRQAAASA
jgi:hypothetical protein